MPSPSGEHGEGNQEEKNCNYPQAGPKSKAKKLSVTQLFAKGRLFKTKRKDPKKQDEDSSP